MDGCSVVVTVSNFDLLIDMSLAINIFAWIILIESKLSI